MVRCGVFGTRADAGAPPLPFWGNHTELAMTSPDELNYYDMFVSIYELTSVVILSLSGAHMRPLFLFSCPHVHVAHARTLPPGKPELTSENI